MDEEELTRIIKGEKSGSERESRPQPDWKQIHGEMKKKGVTLQLLWEEYKAIHPDGYGLSGEDISENTFTVDHTPPSFSGITSAQDAFTSGAVNLAWNAGSDLNTPITYRIFYSTSSGTQNFSTPNTSTQSTSIRITGLTNNQPYYFVVRAEDSFGNEETDTVELSATPTATSGEMPSNAMTYWKFDENTGTVAADVFGNNNGTINGASWITGMSGSALSFDGSGDYVEAPDDSTLEPSQVSVEAWVKRVGTVSSMWHRRIISKAYKSTLTIPYESYAILARNSDYAIGFNLGASDGYHFHFSDVQLQDGVWTHIILTYDGGIAKIYINGSLGFTQNIGKSLIYSDGSLKVGSLDTGYGKGGDFNGLIDEVVIYNNTLSASEVQDLYNAF